MFEMSGIRGFLVNSDIFNDPTNQFAVKQSIQNNTAIEVEGKRTVQDDLALLENISDLCNCSITKLTLTCMELQVEFDSIIIFPNLEELSLNFCSLKFSVMKLDRWCPNLVKLKIKSVNFGKKIWYDDWRSLSENHKSPRLKSLSFKCDDVNNDDVYCYLEAMEKQFPSLEKLDLEFNKNSNFSFRHQRFDDTIDEDDYDYEPLYFDQLKKLSIFAFGKCSNIFNCLAISNKKLKEIEFSGMVADKELIESICNYPKLTKLKLDCLYVYESDLDQLSTRLPKLSMLILDIKYFDWNPSEMMQFIQDAKKLRRLVIEVDRRNDEFDIDEEFIQQFKTLVENGRKLKLHIKFYQSGREITFYESGAIDKSDWMADAYSLDDWCI